MCSFSYARPEEMGISSKAIGAFLDAIEENKVEMHSFLLLRHGKVVSEGWWNPYAPQENHMLFSLSKSFTSTAVGFAVQEGLLSVEDPVLSFFPEVLPYEPCENMKKLKVKHLLTMSTGHIEEPQYEPDQANWVYTFLSSYLKEEPGTSFLYNTPATYMLSAIVQKVSGMTVHDYLTPRFLKPLGIEHTWWQQSPEGINTGGYGLNVKTEDIAKLGLFYLQKGKWEGKQLLSPDWIEAASSCQIENHGGTPDWASGYGYQFWQCVPDQVFRGDGAFGQFCIVMPKQDAVLATTAGVMDMQQILDLVWNYLLPEMKEEPQTRSDADWKVLQEKIALLKVACPMGSEENENATLLHGNTYLFSENKLDVRAVSFDFAGEEPMIELQIGEATVSVQAGYEKWKSCGTEGLEKPFDQIAAAGAWEEDGSCLVTLQYSKTPFSTTFRFLPLEGAIKMTFSQNVDLGGNAGIESICYGVKKK